MSEKRSSKVQKETLIFVINVGIPRCNAKHDTIAFTKMKNIVQHLLQKKIFTRPKDEVGIILMGSRETKNEARIDNISEFCNVMKPNWDLVERILKLESTDCVANWVEAVYVAKDYIIRECVDITSKTILLLSDFNEDKDIMIQFHPETIVKELEEHDIKLLAIGKDPIEEIPECSLTDSAKVLQDVCRMIGGKYLTLNDAIADVRFYAPTTKKSMPCHYNLEFLDLCIPVISFVMVTDSLDTTPWRLAKIGNENSSSMELNESFTVNQMRENFDSNNEPCSENDIAIGYMYGGELITFRDEDEKAMKYKGDRKSLQIYSFVDRDAVSVDYWSMCPVNIIVPGSEDAEVFFYDLAEAMVAENLVALVRKVRQEGDTPKITALFPRINVPNELRCFVQVELPFREDWTMHDIIPLKSILKNVTPEQEEVVENLLNSLMLPDTKEEDEEDGFKLFLPGCLPDVALQNEWNMLAFRALHPNEPLPPMADYLKELFDPPKSVKEKSMPVLKQIKELFQLKEEEKEESANETENPENNHSNDEVMEKENKSIDAKKEEEENTAMNTSNEPVLKVDTIEDFDDMTNRFHLPAWSIKNFPRYVV